MCKLSLNSRRISVIFRVRSAKAIKITDMDLIKRLGIIVGIFVLCLLIRTLVSPPVVIIGELILQSINRCADRPSNPELRMFWCSYSILRSSLASLKYVETQRIMLMMQYVYSRNSGGGDRFSPRG